VNTRIFHVHIERQGIQEREGAATMSNSSSSRSRSNAVREIMKSLEDRRQLTSFIADLAREVQRLEEDNRQLRAAVSIYRQIADRGSRPQYMAGSR
jgi:hypothetical protein